MPYLNQFDAFDPVTGDISEYPITYLPEIGRRARALLGFWNKERVVLAAKKIGDLIDDYFEHARELKIYSLQSDFSPVMRNSMLALSGMAELPQTADGSLMIPCLTSWGCRAKRILARLMR